MDFVGVVVDGIGLGLAHYGAIQDYFIVCQPQGYQFAGGQRDQVVICHAPKGITLEAEIFQAQVGDAGIWHHLR